MLWHEMTSPEIDRLDRDLPVVVPLGSCEQHGRHLPVFVDTIQVEEIVRRIEIARGSRTIILPTLWLGASHHHLDFPGTVSLPPSAYAETIKHIARSLLHHGFRRLFFLNGHGGNLVPASHALTDLIAQDDRADAATLGLATWWLLAADAMAPEKHGMTTPQLTHACEYETSVVLAIQDDLVKLSALASDHHENTRPWLANPRWARKVAGFRRFHRMTSSGHMGDPQNATAAKGISILEAVSLEIVDFLDDFATWPAMKVLRANQ